MTKRNREKIVVVGFGMVGINFVEKLLDLDRDDQYEIVVFGEEPCLPYNRVGLTKYFETREISSLYMKSPEWFESLPKDKYRHYVDALIVELDPEQKTVTASDGSVHSYDRCVLATGSFALVPKTTVGWDAKGVFVYRTVEDLQKMIEYSQNGVDFENSSTKRAVVFGGGLLGLEAAAALKNLQVFDTIDIMERSPHILARQIDPVGAALVVRQVEDLGIKIHVNAFVNELEKNESNEKVKSIKFEDGQILESQMVCFAIGVRARDELGKKAGLKCHGRGGVVVNSKLQTSASDVYAIGECANFEEFSYGLIAPGVEMADVLAFNLTEAKLHQPRLFKTPDMSTKLKLLGVHVASFGDYFADKFGPKSIPKTPKNKKLTVDDVKALVFEDPFGCIYKKYLFSADGKYLLGGIMIGDTADYSKLLSMVKSNKVIDIPAGELIVGSPTGPEDPDSMSNDTQICSCNNISKGQIVEAIKTKACDSIGKVKSCTKAGTTCGGCLPIVQSVFEATMKSMGNNVSSALCHHYDYSRVELFHMISVKQLKTPVDVMRECGKTPDAIGCSVCKPAIASILTSLWNNHIMDKTVIGNQDTNDKYLGNIQRNGTYSIVPRVSAGEITPEKLIVLGQVAKKYNLYTKITGGQRIDLFGAKKHQLPEIWEELINAGFESGHAYGKSLRTVKSCVGSNWCRYGVGDSVGLALALEERYKSIRSPHKLKGGVSGCVRECAEAQGKDFGLIATDKGYNIYVCGNGGSVPKHAQLLIANALPSQVIPILDRFLMFYIRTADRLQRTARWLEKLPGGMDYLKKVILDDALGINAELERQMQGLVNSNFCEWTQVVKDLKKRQLFKQFANTDENIDNVELVKERGQFRPANWPKQDPNVKFKDLEWSSVEWIPIVSKSKMVHSQTGSSCNIKYGDTQLAIFYLPGKGYYCCQSMCPHKRAFVLHDGLVGDDANGNPIVTCPLHKREYNISADRVLGGTSSDPAMSVATFEVKEEFGMIYVRLPPVAEIDSQLGTSRWMVRSGETDNQLDIPSLIGRKGGCETACGGDLSW
ncbi:hypothetical protein HDV04_005531 [Boothiomyces sp. JEL0838]|nr:hypothetical protein HDV04_005531 [Boothiomyces sp. JEL0838]